VIGQHLGEAIRDFTPKDREITLTDIEIISITRISL
jgi:hypothetical protein